jgi:hypothetical protein
LFELGEKTCLSRSGLSAHDGELHVLLSPGAAPQRLEQRELRRAPDQGQVVGGIRAEGSAAIPLGSERQCLPYLDRLALALQEHRSALSEVHVWRRELGGQPAAEHLAWSGRLLEPSGDVDRVSDHRYVATPDCGRHHLTGVDPYCENEVAG